MLWEDDPMDVEQLLEDSKNEVVTDGNLCMDLEDPKKCLAVEDFPCSINNYDRSFDGTMESYATQGVDQEPNSKFEFLDDVLQVDQEHLHVTSLLDDCSDYLIDTSFTGPVAHLYYDSYQVNDSENLGSHSQYPSTLCKDNDDARQSGLPGAIIPLPEAGSEQNQPSLENLNIHDLHEAFRFTFGRDTSVKDKYCFKRQLSHGLDELREFDNASRILDKQQLSSDDGVIRRRHGGNGLPTGFTQVTSTSYRLSDVGDTERTLSTNKRLRKPTRRYIEESSEINPSYIRRRLEPPAKALHDSFSEVRSSGQKPWKNFESMALVFRQDSLGGSGIQVPFVLRVRRGRPRRNCTSLLVDNSKDNEDHMIVVPKRIYEPHRCEVEDDSDDYGARVRTAKGGIRRKHHRSWTLQEVMKLVEGVSRHGVGRWSDIKRLEFSSSAYRTSVDLKDKWRNLLKASYAQLQVKKVVEQRRRHASISIPTSILMRVRELAAMHPKERQSVALQHAPASSTISVPIKNASISRGGRTVQKRQSVEF